METIAITNWNNIVSPLYDSSCCLLIARLGGGYASIDIRNLSAIEKALVCKKEGVSVLICGAISNIAKAVLIENGVKVVAWIRGPVADIICAYRKNEDITKLYAMPGCGSRMCRGRYHKKCYGMQ